MFSICFGRSLNASLILDESAIKKMSNAQYGPEDVERTQNKKSKTKFGGWWTAWPIVPGGQGRTIIMYYTVFCEAGTETEPKSNK